jgi:hypothetical protein
LYTLQIFIEQRGQSRCDSAESTAARPGPCSVPCYFRGALPPAYAATTWPPSSAQSNNPQGISVTRKCVSRRHCRSCPGLQSTTLELGRERGCAPLHWSAGWWLSRHFRKCHRQAARRLCICMHQASYVLQRLWLCIVAGEASRYSIRGGRRPRARIATPQSV